MDSAEECKMEITETLQVPKEEWKEERDIETLLVPKEECEVGDIENPVVPKDECKASDIETPVVPKEESKIGNIETHVVPKVECREGDVETIRVSKEQGESEKLDNQGQRLVGRFVQKDFKDYGQFIGKVVSFHPAQGFYRVKYEDGDREDLELHELRDILLENDNLAGELSGRKQQLEKLLQQESRKRSRTGQLQKRRQRQRQRPGKGERAHNGIEVGSGNDFSPCREFGELPGDSNNACKDDGQVDEVKEAETEGNIGKCTENTEAETERNILVEENVKTEIDCAVVGLECKPKGKETDGAVKGLDCKLQGVDAVEGSDFKCQGRKTDGAVELGCNPQGRETDGAVELGCNPQGRETDGAVDGSVRNQQYMGTAAAVEGFDCKRQGRETDGAVEGSECMRQVRGKRKGISEDGREPKQKRQRRCKSTSDGGTAVSSKLARQSQQRTHGKSGAEKVAFSSEDNSCEQKSELSETRESASQKLELPRRRGRGKSRIGSVGYPQKHETCHEHPDTSSPIKLLHQTAVSSDQQKKRPQRNSARKASVHIFSQEGDSDIEKDKSCSEESFHVSDEDLYSSSDASDTEDSGQVLLLTSKAIDVPLPPVKPLPQSSGDLSVPESSVLDLFSVYSFLRRFSNLLFLSPFNLDDFVGALNYKSANTLLDSVHICLLKAARRHLESLSVEGNDKASKCFRQLDWNFLDAVTWPVYLVEYLSTQGFSSHLGQNISHLKLLNGEYYTILPSTKLTILQFLCDDIMEAEEVRTEINMRVNFEQDTDADVKINFSSGATGLIEINPCYSKRKRVSCTKADGQRRSNSSQVTLENTNFHSDNSVSQNKHSYSKNGQTEFTSPEVNDGEDLNSDECCLCGMDGNLICCDGCPSAYHFRCVGLSKAHLPEGAWYCPECVVEKIDAQGSRASKSLSGAEIFGIDPYGRVFFGTCGYLLVSDSASNPTTMYRYYNKRDAIKVIEILEFSGPFYDDIRNSILQYWGVPEGKKDSACFQKTDMASGNSPVALSCLSVSEHLVEQEDVSASGVISVSSERKAEKDCSVLSDKTHHKRQNELLVTGPCNFKEAEIRSYQDATGVVPNSSVCWNSQECGNALEQQLDLDPGRTVTQIELLKCSPIPGQQQAKEDTPDWKGVQEDRSISNLPVVYMQTDDIGKAAVKMGLVSSSLDCKASFRPNAYINCYVLGDIAASAAANLASLSVEDNRLVNRRGSFKKTFSATISEQVKIFSKAAVQFCWPSYKKKSMEPPKERCGWCASCKSSASCRRACLLNLAACNIMAGAANVHGGLRPTKSGEGHLPAVAAYILYIEDCLCGLVVGPWENLDYRKHWRRCLEQASTAKEIRASLLGLEKNIRLIALAAGWTKHVDDWSPQVSAAHTGTSVAVTTAKRGGNGKRLQKNSTLIAMTAPIDARVFRNFYWCKGGRLSTQVLQLPYAIAKRAGRQGGTRKISGILYVEGCDFPRRSRQYTWRAAVERARSVSQLAVQVRYLDAYIKWKDLVYPEDCHDGKAVDKEGISFRNATVCGKIYEGGEAKYLLDFGNQKDIPICAVKHGRKNEETEGSGNKYWLGEFHVPLYVLKPFEDGLLRDCPNKGSKQVWKGQNRPMKRIRIKDIYSFLLSKEEMNGKCSCAQCGKEVLVRKSVKCNFCEGSFHQGCTVTSDWIDRSECNFTCYKCYNFKLTEKRDNILKTTLKKGFAPVVIDKQVQDDHLRLRYKVEEHKGSPVQSFDANAAVQNYPGVDRFLVQRKKSSGSFYQNGLLWKKNLCDELGKDFRKNKLLLPCQNSMGAAEGPRCYLCRESYNPKLIYIGCEHCKEWFHGDAFGLNQENIVQLGGFKCHRCRKKSGPVCPHAGMDNFVKRKKLLVKRSETNISRNHFGTFNEVGSLPVDVIHGGPGHSSNDLLTKSDSSVKRKKLLVKRSETIIDRDHFDNFNEVDSMALDVIHGKPGHSSDELCTTLDSSVERKKLLVKRSETNIDRDHFDNFNEVDSMTLDVIHGKPGHSSNELCTTLDSSVKRKKLLVKRSETNIDRDHFDNFNEKVDSTPLDVKHGKPRHYSNELCTTLDCAEQKYAAVNLEPVFEHASQVTPSSDHQSIAESKTYQQSECTPQVGAEDAIHGKPGHSSNVLWTTLDSSVKRKKLLVKRSETNIVSDHFDNFNEKVNSIPLDVIHGRPGHSSNELCSALDCAEQKYAAVKLEPVFEHASQVPPSSDHQSIAESETYQQSECTPQVGAEDLSSQVDWDFSVNDCLHDDQQIEFKEPSFEYMEPYSENEPLFSLTELLASEVDQAEDLVDPSQGIIENSSDCLSDNKEIGTGSQALGVEPQGFPYNGPLIPSSTTENIAFQLPNDFSQENLMGFQLHGTANKETPVENQYHAVDNTVSLEEFQMHSTANKLVSEEIGKLCKVCGFTVLPPDYQCKVCGVAIHCHCYDWNPLGAWTAFGWTCDSCQGGLIQDKGFYQ